MAKRIPAAPVCQNGNRLDLNLDKVVQDSVCGEAGDGLDAGLAGYILAVGYDGVDRDVILGGYLSATCFSG